MVDHASSHVDEFYLFAEQLIKKGNAYVCFCSQDKMRENRNKGIECECRNNDLKKNIRGWEDMFVLKEGQAVLRIKIDMQHLNTTMRDPVLMRIIEHEHPLVGKKYRIWPNYDFENSVMDGLQRITHRLRTKEFELRNELQRHIQKELGFAETKIFEFARFNLEGVESSGRIIREKIEKGEMIGWDDPGLTTLVALRRRGFVPEAIKNFVISTGITKAEATLTWDDLIVQNRRLLDSSCNRYFFIEEPVHIEIKDAPELFCALKLHPDHAERGQREFKTHSKFIITKHDLNELKDGELYRLMDCLNFEKKGNEFHFDSREHDKYKGRGKKIMHWLADSRENAKTEIMMPDKSIRHGFAEKGVRNLAVGDVIQFERFGFCRLDHIDEKENKHVFWYAHK